MTTKPNKNHIDVAAVDDFDQFRDLLSDDDLVVPEQVLKPPQETTGTRLIIWLDLNLKIQELNTLAEKVLAMPRSILAGQDLRTALENAGLNPVGLMRMMLQLKQSCASSHNIEYLNTTNHQVALSSSIHLVKDNKDQPHSYLFLAKPSAQFEMPGESTMQIPAHLKTESKVQSENAALSYLFEVSAQLSALKTHHEILLNACQAISYLPTFVKPIMCLLDERHQVRTLVYDKKQFKDTQITDLKKITEEHNVFPLHIFSNEFRLSQTYLFTQEVWRTLADSGRPATENLKRFPIERDVLIFLLRFHNERVFGLAMVEYSASKQQLSMGMLKALEIFLGSVAVTIEQRSLDRKLSQINRELRIKNEDLAQMDKLKAEFISNVAHELKTPIAVGMGYAELLSSTMIGNIPPEQQDALKQVLESLQTLNQHLSGLLDFTDLNKGMMVLKPSTFDASRLLESVYDQRARVVKAKKLNFVKNVPKKQIEVYGDVRKIEVVLRILVDNAAKFSEKGTITLGVTLRERVVEFFVQDEGIGMTEDMITYVFDNFRQGDGSATRQFGGFGLGLGLARHIISLHDEKFWVQSKVDEGSTFYFTLPRVNHKTHQTRLQNQSEPAST